MTTMASQITRLTVVYSIVYRAQIKENIKAPRYCPLCGEFTGTGEFPAQRASNAENVSIWWRHHVSWHPFLRCQNSRVVLSVFYWLWPESSLSFDPLVLNFIYARVIFCYTSMTIGNAKTVFYPLSDKVIMAIVLQFLECAFSYNHALPRHVHSINTLFNTYSDLSISEMIHHLFG